jgi:hypothetical protein
VQTIAQRSAVASREQVILAAESHGTDCAFDRIGVEFDAAVMQKARQFLPTGERIADRFGQRAAPRYSGQLRFEPIAQGLDDRPGKGPPFGQATSVRLTAHARLDGMEFADPAQRLGRNRRASGFGDFVELAPCVRPTADEHNVAIGGQSLKAGMAVDMQHTLETLEMRGRTFRLAVGREEKDRRQRLRSGPWPLFTRI